MSDTNRHRAPTAEMLANRAYRKLLLIEKDLAVLRAHMPGIVKHCERLLREKETLMNMVGDVHVEDYNRILREANGFMARPIRADTPTPIIDRLRRMLAEDVQ